MQRNDSSIDLYQKVENDSYHLGQLNGPVSQTDIQRNMVGFVVDGHIYCYIQYLWQTFIGCENARQVLNATFIKQTFVNEREELIYKGR